MIQCESCWMIIIFFLNIYVCIWDNLVLQRCLRIPGMSEVTYAFEMIKWLYKYVLFIVHELDMCLYY